MNSKKQLLLIEDESDIVSLITLYAEISNYALQVETNGTKGLDRLKKIKPDLVLLDLMLPGMNGYDICYEMKKDSETKDTPLIILSAKGEEIDMMLGFELGADDYVLKPFSLKVLFARIQAVLRRNFRQTEKKKVHQFGPFQLHIDRCEVMKDRKLVPLTLSEFGILKQLVINQGVVLTRDQLLDTMKNTFLLHHNIDVHIVSLRKKLGLNFSWIETIRGVGYRFEPRN